MRYANVIVDITSEKLDRTFQYCVPDSLEEKLKVGMVVEVPFGKGDRKIDGYVIELTDTPQFDVKRLKCIRAIKSDERTTQSRLIILAQWMSRHYGATMIQALKTVFPVKEKVRQCQRRTLVLRLSPEEARAQLQELERKKYQSQTAAGLDRYPQAGWCLGGKGAGGSGQCDRPHGESGMDSDCV